MISINEALDIIKNNLPDSESEQLGLVEAIDRCLAEDILAPEASPRFTNSAMDGFAVRWEDVGQAGAENPVTLRIVGESRAGEPFEGEISRGEAIRISTGAMLPDTADTVVRLEDTRLEEECLTILAVRKKGQDIRYRGEEFKPGDLLLRKGTGMSAPQVALLASVGVEKISVFRPCRVALLTTGSEFAGAGEVLHDYQIRDSNMALLSAAIREAGGEVVFTERITDDRAATVRAIDRAKGADIVLCAGGVSVGPHDHVKEAAEENDFVRLFWRVRQKPGKPLYFARHGTTLLFGLPGNPVSAYMCFTHYVRPVITSLAGRPFGWPMASARACADIVNRGKRTNLLRIRITKRSHEGYGILGAERQGSHMLTSLAHANGYIILGPGETLKNGEQAEVYLYDFKG